MNRYPFMKEFIETKTCDSKELVLEKDIFDFALIDGDHTYEGVKNDFLKIISFMRYEGVMCFHDNSVHFPGVQKFIEELKDMKEMVCLGEAGSATCFKVKRNMNVCVLDM